MKLRLSKYQERKLRIFDQVSSNSGLRINSGKANGSKNKSKKSNQGKIGYSPEQIRAKLAAHQASKGVKKSSKLNQSKETSTFMSEQNASKVSLNSINKNSQETAKTEGALFNDPTDPYTVNKLKDALNSGVLRIDDKTKSVLGQIISERGQP